MTEIPELHPALVGDGPARDERFTVKDRWIECHNLPDDDPERDLEFLHRQMNEELNVLENAAQSLVDFPEEPWEIRLYLARQASDEARHVLVYKDLLESRGLSVGQYPIMNFQYKILTQIDSLIGRLAVQNRTFEADGLDAAMHGIDEMRAKGDYELANTFDAQTADEILHVGFAKEWIRKEVERNPANAMKMARALSWGAQAFEQVFAGGGTDVDKYPVAEEARAMAGFTEEEVRVAAEMSEKRRAQVAERRALKGDN
jgi:uncharacterized ferritin-like protein (DUF455 family)